MNALQYISSYFFKRVVEKRKSEVSTAVEVVYANGRYMLDSARANYSFGGLHAVFQKAFSHFKIRQRKISSALILGFGSGSVASILQDEYGMEPEIVGVEKDSEVIALAKKYFLVERYKKLSLVNEDAYDFVLRCNRTFDLVVMDVFVDLEVPGKFSEEKFITALSKLLNANGILFYNLVIHNEKARDKGAQLFKDLNRLAGNTEWFRIHSQQTENWVFVSRK